MLTLALLAVLVYERSAARAFWIGFAVVGWGNLGLQRFPLAEVSLTDLVSESLMDAIHPSPPPLGPAAEQPGSAGQIDPYGAAPPAATGSDVDVAGPVPPQPAAYDVGAARNAFPYLIIWIWPLLLGFVGGVVAQQLYLRRERLATSSQRA